MGTLIFYPGRGGRWSSSAFVIPARDAEEAKRIAIRYGLDERPWKAPFVPPKAWFHEDEIVRLGNRDGWLGFHDGWKKDGTIIEWQKSATELTAL